MQNTDQNSVDNTTGNFKIGHYNLCYGALCKFNMFDFTIFSIMCLDEVGILLTSKKHLSICGSESAVCRTEFWGLYADNFEIVCIKQGYGAF